MFNTLIKKKLYISLPEQPFLVQAHLQELDTAELDGEGYPAL